MLTDTLFIDQKYIELLGPYLDRFQKLDSNLWNFRCPFCGDSQKSKYKARGYFHRHDGIMMFKCHNGCDPLPFGAFLKRSDPSLYRQYRTDIYLEGGGKLRVTKAEEYYTDDDKETAPVKFMVRPKKQIPLPMQSVKDLPFEHYARAYVRERLIPQEQYRRIYHSDYFVGSVRFCFPEYFKVDRHKAQEKIREPRLVLPFYDRLKNLVGLTGRSYDPNAEKRYIICKADEHAPKVYGLDEVDPKERVLVCEGPIDSLFLPNAIATMDGKLHGIDDRTEGLQLLNRVLCPDNQPRNEGVCRSIHTAIEAGEAVVLWPTSIAEKDINAMVKDGGLSVSEILDLIDKHTVKGLSAKLRFSKWQKIK